LDAKSPRAFQVEARTRGRSHEHRGELTRRVPAGAKLHTARSRNEQVALDVRLWLRTRLFCCSAKLPICNARSSRSAKKIPACSFRLHAPATRPAGLPRAPSARLRRDARTRLRAPLGLPLARERLPLGSGAIAGSTLPLDRVLVAKLLGFVDANGRPQLTQNSMDAVSDRDFAVEFCAAGALLAVHLSRLAEDVISGPARNSTSSSSPTPTPPARR